MFRGDRLQSLIEDRGWSQGELARRVGISTTAIWKLVNNPAQGSKHIHRIASELGTSPEFLMGETDDPDVGAGRNLPAPSLREVGVREDTVELAEFDVSYGLGASYIHDTPVTGRQLVFSRSWIRQFTDSPFDCLFWGTGMGDSMTPTIQDADVVLIDTAQRTPRVWDKIWAVEVGGLGAIKRLRPTKDGTGMRLLSSNPDVPEEVTYDDELNVVGRVVAIVRKV